MRRMKRPAAAFWVLVFAAAAAVPGSAQAGLESLFDFAAGVESLASAAEAGEPLPVGRYVLLTGTVRSVQAGEDEGYAVLVELAAGEWVGTSRVLLRTVTVRFAGESWRGLFDRKSAVHIRPGIMILAVARVSGVRDREDGTRGVFLEGVHIRSLDS